ncbi:MAG: hypothetical protein KBA02_00035 [Paludibacteraceae bacterium]|nr:hypothetical protein [Paludibacteraceae bacterium]
MQIPGTVIGSKIVPSDTADTYPTHEDIYGKGGLISVADSTARNAIPNDRCKEGMLVVTQSDGQLWRLKSGFSNPTVDGDWENNIDTQNASPSLTLTNITEEDTDGGRESSVLFKGYTSTGDLHTLAEIKAKHVTDPFETDVYLAELEFYTSNGDALRKVLTLKNYDSGIGGHWPKCYFYSANNAIGLDARFSILRSLGNEASPTAVQDGIALGSFIIGGHDGTNWDNFGALIQAVANETWTNTNHGTTLTIGICKKGAASISTSVVMDDSKVETVGRFTLKPTTTQSIVAGTGITNVDRSMIRVAGSGGAVTVSATPSIVDSYDGAIIIICGTDDTNTVTLQDESNLANSGLQLNTAANCTLGKGDTLQLTYNSTDDKWYEISRSNN